MADRGWKRPFDDPIQLPRGRSLITLEDAGDYIMKLKKAEHEAPGSRTPAAEALARFRAAPDRPTKRPSLSRCATPMPAP